MCLAAPHFTWIMMCRLYSDYLEVTTKTCVTYKSIKSYFYYIRYVYSVYGGSGWPTQKHWAQYAMFWNLIFLILGNELSTMKFAKVLYRPAAVFYYRRNFRQMTELHSYEQAVSVENKVSNSNHSQRFSNNLWFSLAQPPRRLMNTTSNQKRFLSSFKKNWGF